MLWRTLAGITETDWVEAIDMPGAQVAVADYHPAEATLGRSACPQPTKCPTKINNGLHQRSTYRVTHRIGSERRPREGELVLTVG